MTNQQSMYIVRGLPATGKSTFAKQFVLDNPDCVRVSRDDIRRMLFTEPNHTWGQEKVVTELEKHAVEQALSSGKSVIIDAMHLRDKYIKAWLKVAKKFNVDVYYSDFVLPLEEMIARDSLRLGVESVGEEFIRDLYTKFVQKDGTLRPAPEATEEGEEQGVSVSTYSGTSGKPLAFIVDIDGTLAHNTCGRGWYHWERVGEDEVDLVVADIVRRLADRLSVEPTLKVIVMSGRDEVCRPQTEEWLSRHKIPFDELFMRKQNDYRKDNIVKEELFNTYVRDNYDVRFVIDDRWTVCETWLRMGLKVLNVSGLDRGEF